MAGSVNPAVRADVAIRDNDRDPGESPSQLQQPLDIGLRLAIDSSIDKDKAQLPVVLDSGKVGVMNSGEYVRFFVQTLAASKDDLEATRKALNETDAAQAEARAAQDALAEKQKADAAAAEETARRVAEETDAKIAAASKQTAADLDLITKRVADLDNRIELLAELVDNLQSTVDDIASRGDK